MSLILAVVATVAATPVPTPEVVIHTVYVTPAWAVNLGDFLRQAALLAIFVVPGYLSSWVHSLVNKTKDGTKRFAQWQSAALLFSYSFIFAGLGLVAEATFNLANIDWTNPAVIGGAFLTVLGAAAARYNKEQLVAPKVVTPVI